MQLRLIFYKTLIKTNRKSEKFKLSRFLAIEKTVEEGQGLCFVIIIIFVSTDKFPI